MGGDSYGILKAGCDVVAYSELEKVFRETHDLNFNNCKLLGNGNILETKDDEFLKYKNDVDLIFAGFPCQGFSNAGKKLPDDPRNTLFREFLRATKLIEPNYIIGENVKGLSKRLTSDGKKFIDIIKKEFENIGYDIDFSKYVNNINVEGNERFIVKSSKKTIPNFLINSNYIPESTIEILSGYKIVGDFLEKTILRPNNINYPKSRAEFIELLK